MTDIVNPPAIDALPPEPLPTDTPAEFNSKGFALVAALKKLVAQTNAALTNVYNNALVALERAAVAAASALTATQQADAAMGYRNAAASSASSASAQAGNASTSAGQAASAITTIQKYTLGGKASNPEVDNQGNPLQRGAMYFNTTDSGWYWYSGSGGSSGWIKGGGNPETVDWNTQVTNKPNVMTTDTDQTIGGWKTFTLPIRTQTGSGMQSSGGYYSRTISTATRQWVTLCEVTGVNVLTYSKFLLRCGGYFTAEITCGKTVVGPQAGGGSFEYKVVAGYGFYAEQPAAFRIIMEGNNIFRLDMCLPGTVSATVNVGITVLTEHASTGAVISYPILNSAPVTGSPSTPNAVIVGTGTGVSALQANLYTGAAYCAIIDGSGAVGQTPSLSNTGATG